VSAASEAASRQLPIGTRNIAAFALEHDTQPRIEDRAEILIGCHPLQGPGKLRIGAKAA